MLSWFSHIFIQKRDLNKLPIQILSAFGNARVGTSPGYIADQTAQATGLHFNLPGLLVTTVRAQMLWMIIGENNDRKIIEFMLINQLGTKTLFGIYRKELMAVNHSPSLLHSAFPCYLLSIKSRWQLSAQQAFCLPLLLSIDILDDCPCLSIGL